MFCEAAAAPPPPATCAPPTATSSPPGRAGRSPVCAWRATPEALARKPTVEILVTPEARRLAMEDDIRTGLTSVAKSIPPVWFYDEVGSRLFDQITRLPEYYLTRAERSILEARAQAVAAETEADTLVEIGSGTSEKTRLLLDAMAATGQLRHVVL